MFLINLSSFKRFASIVQFGPSARRFKGLGSAFPECRLRREVPVHASSRVPNRYRGALLSLSLLLTAHVSMVAHSQPVEQGLNAVRHAADTLAKVLVIVCILYFSAKAFNHHVWKPYQKCVSEQETANGPLKGKFRECAGATFSFGKEVQL